MQRLLHSSKFWALVMAVLTTGAVGIFGDAAVQDVVNEIFPILLAVSGVVYALTTAFEDGMGRHYSIGDILSLGTELTTEFEEAEG